MLKATNQCVSDLWIDARDDLPISLFLSFKASRPFKSKALDGKLGFSTHGSRSFVTIVPGKNMGSKEDYGSSFDSFGFHNTRYQLMFTRNWYENQIFSPLLSNYGYLDSRFLSLLFVRSSGISQRS